jgi:hypothetical protein
MRAHEQKVTFKPPPGAVPEGTAQGEDFDLVCTFRVEQGGRVCLTQMGEHRLPGYTGSQETAHKPAPSYADEAMAMQGAMGGGAPPGGGYG